MVASRRASPDHKHAPSPWDSKSQRSPWRPLGQRVTHRLQRKLVCVSHPLHVDPLARSRASRAKAKAAGSSHGAKAMTIAIGTRTDVNVLQHPRGRADDQTAAIERSKVGGRLPSIPDAPTDLVDRAMLFALDRDSELRARYLRQRWQNFAEWHG